MWFSHPLLCDGSETRRNALIKAPQREVCLDKQEVVCGGVGVSSGRLALTREGLSKQITFLYTFGTIFPLQRHLLPVFFALVLFYFVVLVAFCQGAGHQ